MNKFLFSLTRPIRAFTTSTAPIKDAVSLWQPKKRVSRETMEKIRTLASNQPDVYNALKISQEYKLSVEAVRRILKSKYKPTPKDAERQERNRYKAMGDRQKAFRAQDKPQEQDKFKSKFLSKSPKDEPERIFDANPQGNLRYKQKKNLQLRTPFKDKKKSQ